ncbi:MAG: GAF domain-containing protein [Acidobacteriia bacterium]|nr:GAF domain-containing protein [Terriglobia bacterium]
MMEECSSDRICPQIPGNDGDIGLEQALDRCAACCLNGCLETAPGDQTHTVWLKLYTASERLRIAVHEHDVLQALLEIGSNLMACEEMAVVTLQEDGRLSVLASSGLTEHRAEALMARAEQIAAEVGRGQITIVNASRCGNALWSELGIIAFVPVWHKSEPRGALIFYKLLPQRTGFDAADYELLQLLSMYSGACLFSA